MSEEIVKIIERVPDQPGVPKLVTHEGIDGEAFEDVAALKKENGEKILIPYERIQRIVETS